MKVTGILKVSSLRPLISVVITEEETLRLTEGKVIIGENDDFSVQIVGFGEEEDE